MRRMRKQHDQPNVEVKQEDMERSQKVPKKKIRKLRPGRPKLTERGASTIPDILSIHEQTVLLALLCNGWGVSGEQELTVDPTKKEVEQNISHIDLNIRLIIDEHPHLQNQSRQRETLSKLVDEHYSFLQFLDRLKWLCSTAEFDDVLLLYAILFSQEEGSALLDTPEAVLEVVIEATKAVAGKWKTRFQEMLPHLALRVASTASDRPFGYRFSQFLLMLIGTAVCIFKDKTENPFHDELFARSLEDAGEVHGRSQPNDTSLSAGNPSKHKGRAEQPTKRRRVSSRIRLRRLLPGSM